MYTLAKAAHTRATSFAVAQHSFLQLLSLKMTSSFAEYVDRLLAQNDSFIAISFSPFHGISKIQTTKISINPTHSEYNAFSMATKHIKFYRRYLAWLGYPQPEPTPLENDCAPAFSILTAQSFPKNSKNLLVQDRNVREAYRDQILTPVHVLSKGFATDLNAKPSGPTDFLANRAVLLNIKANPDFARPPISLYCLYSLLRCSSSSHAGMSVQRYTYLERNGWIAWRSCDERSRKWTLKDPRKLSLKDPLWLVEINWWQPIVS